MNQQKLVYKLISYSGSPKISTANPMKKDKKHIVPTDEDYVGNLNLVTGAKYNYDKQPSTQSQIRELCIDEKKTKLEKFVKIIKDGEKIQKWSVLENLNYYCYPNVPQSHHKKSLNTLDVILENLSKNYSQLIDYLPIIGQGISTVFDDSRVPLSESNISLIYGLGFRTLTQNPAQAEQWEHVFDKIGQSLNKGQIDACYEYIMGAFQMNSPPQKRRTAFIMMNSLFEYSSKIESQSEIKVLFFNSDQNVQTRLTIAKLMFKILSKKPQSGEIWKSVWQYYHDQEEIIKNIAVQIIFSIFYPKNFTTILDSVLNHEHEEDLVLSHIDIFLQAYKQTIHQDKKSQMEIMAFCNRILFTNKTELIALLLFKLKDSLIPSLGQAKIFSDVNFTVLPLDEPLILENLFGIYEVLQSIQCQDTLKKMILKGLKVQQYSIGHNADNLVNVIDLGVEQQINIYFALCSNSLDKSKWIQFQDLLKIFNTLKPFQMMYDKFCLLMIRALTVSPILIAPKIIDCIVHLMIVNKRSLQFFITIRQKLLSAKSWLHRYQYIMLYAAIKAETSFEYHKMIPCYLYRNIVTDKTYGVKLGFLKEAPKIYKYTEPDNTLEKNMIKEVATKLLSDKDSYVRIEAQKCRKQLDKIDKDTIFLQQLYRRNQKQLEKEQLTIQVQTQQKRTIKTENQIRKSLFKKKTLGENRKTTNVLNKQRSIHKDVSIDSLSTLSHKKGLIPDYTKEKKVNLFRCHSVKMKGALKKKQI